MAVFSGKVPGASERLVSRAFGARAVSRAIAVALLAASGAPALAVDATGTWSGNAHCRPQPGVGIIMKERRASTLRITQRGEALFIEMDGAAYRGRSEDSPRNPIRARGSAVRCGDDGAECPPTSSVLDLTIKINETRGTTRIAAVSTISGRRHCRYRFGRTGRADPGVGQPDQGAFCGDAIVNDAGEECDGAAIGTPCDGACMADCTCPTSCEPLDVSGHWNGTWTSAVTAESGQVVADLSQEGEFVFGPISFPPFGDENFSPPFLQMSACAPADFSSGAILPSGIVGLLQGTATNTSLAGTWAMSDASDYGTWQLSR